MDKSDRLTRRNPDGDVTLIGEDTLPMVRLTERVSAALEKLASYEDAEEQGRLVRLPIQAGQTVYILVNPTINIEGITPCIDEETVKSVWFSDSIFGRNWSIFTDKELYSGRNIGKDVFLTRAEAEAALKALNAAQQTDVGEWRESGDGFFDFCYCSRCGHKERRETSLPPLCPSCGARMAK